MNGVLGTLGFTWLRGTNRYSVWILALALLWTVGRLSRAKWTRRRKLSVAAAALAAGIAFADQRPRWSPEAQLATVSATIASDRTFARALEASLPASAMIFMLPVVDCPEGERVLRATDYENFRPYLYTRQVRFSYGSDKGRPRDAWQRRVESLEPDAMARALERMGFAGVIVNRKAYDDGAAAFRQRLAASGREEAWESPNRDFLFVRLQPVASPETPQRVVGADAGRQAAKP
jgi:phosphoglycerol transferase